MLGNEGDHLGPYPLTGGLHFRPLQPVDFGQLKAAHRSLFPIDYEDAFFHSAVLHGDGIISAAATQRIGPHEELVGFITARVSLLHECNPTDRVLMNLNSAYLDGQRVLYILTLGVLESARQQGIGSALLRLILEEAQIRNCLSAFLHVIDYNLTAMAFYQRSKFQEIALLHDFYYIGTGRQRMPTQTRYNAFLYALPLLQPPAERLRGTCLASVRLPFRTLMGGLTLWCTWLWRAFILQSAATSKEHSRDLEQGVGPYGHAQEPSGDGVTVVVVIFRLVPMVERLPKALTDALQTSGAAEHSSAQCPASQACKLRGHIGERIGTA